MANERAGELINLMRDNQLLDAAQLEELNRTPGVLDIEPELLAQCLIEMGWVTLYQLDLVTQNKTQELRIGNYLVLDKAGVGNLGPAYKVRRPGKPGTFILKHIPKDKFSEGDMLPRFNQDVRIAAQIQHPNIAPVLTVGQLGTQYLFVREFVDGTDLAQLVRDTGPLPIARACTAIRQAALGLQHAHEKSLIHRRLKPSNLIAVKGNGSGPGTTIKVVDFGLANIRPRTKDDKGDRDGDLRGLGRAFCYLLTGRAPTPPDSTWQTPPGAGPLSTLRPGIPVEVQSIALKLLGAGSATGYRNMADAAAALEPYAREPVEAAAPPPASNGVSGVVASAIPVLVGARPTELAPIPFATAAVAAVPVAVGFGAGLADASEPVMAELPFAMAVTQAVSVERVENEIEIGAACITEALPMATATPPIPEPIAPEPAVEPACAVPVEGVAVAVSGVVPVEVSPAFGLEVAPPLAVPLPASSPNDADIPMASAVVAAVPAALASEPVFSNAVPEPAMVPPPEPAAMISAPPETPPDLPPSSTLAIPPMREAPPLPAETAPAVPVPSPAVESIEPLRTPELSPAPLLAPTVPEPVPAPALAPPIEALGGMSAAPAPAAPMAPAAAVTAPENIPMGSAFDGTATAFTDAPAEDAFPMSSAPPRRKGRKKLSKGTIIGLIIGAVLHLIFIVGIIWWIVAASSSSEPPKPKNATRQAPRITKGLPTGAGFPMDNSKIKKEKGGDVNPFDDVKD